MAYSNKVPEARALNHPTYWLIHRRLKDLGIDYTKFYERDLTVYESKLDGISFITKKVTNPLEGNDFLTAIRIATRGGRPAFREGKKFENEHWAVDASMGATTGIGFREIMYLDPPKKLTRASDPTSLQMNPQADPMFTASSTATRSRSKFLRSTPPYGATSSRFTSTRPDSSCSRSRG